LFKYFSNPLESVNLEGSIQQKTRGALFILCKGSTIKIILESKPFIRVCTTEEAVIVLMANCYIFHLDYSAKVSNALLFIQSLVLARRLRHRRLPATTNDHLAIKFSMLHTSLILIVISVFFSVLTFCFVVHPTHQSSFDQDLNCLVSKISHPCFN
jgi:hypothetical protein